MTKLFVCEPYRAKLSPAACGKRYRAARRARGRWDATQAVDASCVGCPVGKAHAAGRESGAADVELGAQLPAASAPKPVPAGRPPVVTHPWSARDCRGCGSSFLPKARNQLYCAPACRPSAKAKQVARRQKGGP